MSKNYDNWDRLVTVVLRRQHDRELALRQHSTTDTSSRRSSVGSASSSSEFNFYDEPILPRATPMDYCDLILDHQQWKAMLPPGQREVLYKSASMRFFLDDSTGKNSFLFGAANIISGEVEMQTHSKSRFSNVAGPVDFAAFHLCSEINTLMLSPNTHYQAYFVFELTNVTNTETTPISVTSAITFFYAGSCTWESDPTKLRFELVKYRADGWQEILLGGFYVDEGRNGVIRVHIADHLGQLRPSRRYIVEGIEFRPEPLHKQEMRRWRVKGNWINHKPNPFTSKKSGGGEKVTGPSIHLDNPESEHFTEPR